MNTSMDFITFTAALAEEIKTWAGKDCEVLPHTAQKNNGVTLTGILLKRKGQNTFPAVYLNDFYQEYRKGAKYREILKKIIGVFRDAEVEERVDLSDFQCYQKAASRILFKLINYEKNKKLLEQIPHKRFHNLAVVFYYTVTEPPFSGRGMILIYNSHREDWGVSTDELYERAMENTPRLLPAQMGNLGEMVSDMLKEQGEEDAGEACRKQAQEKEDFPMYVLTNEQQHLGAACMLYPHIVEEFAARLRKDVYILPSSVHEVILLPFSEYISREALLDMVTEINRTQVEKCEVLADSVYCFHRKNGRIEQIL